VLSWGWGEMSNSVWQLLTQGPVMLAMIGVALYLLTAKREPRRPVRLAGVTLMVVVAFNVMLLGFRE
jgi:hypothetical protein